MGKLFRSLVTVILLVASAAALAWGDYGAYARDGQYGNPYGNDSNSIQLYGSDGEYLGNLNDNAYDPNSVSNPYGRYGNPYSPDSINNPYRYE